jgi:hypothetical protein
MTRWPGRRFKHMNANLLHVYTECPEGSIIAIAKCDTIHTTDERMKGLEWCAWCRAKDEHENPPRHYYGKP